MSSRAGPGATTWAGLAVVAVAAAVLSFAALHDLALACGIVGAVAGVPLAALLPVAIDAAGVVSTRLWLTLPTGHPARVTARAVALSALGLSVAGNGAQHGMAAYGVLPPWWTVVLVSAVPPVALAAVAHLAALVGRTDPPEGDNSRPEDDEGDEGDEDNVRAHTPFSSSPSPADEPNGVAEDTPDAVLPVPGESTGAALPVPGGPGEDRAAVPGGPGEDRAADLIAAGAGRRRLSREMSITEHEARRLLAASRNGVAR